MKAYSNSTTPKDQRDKRATPPDVFNSFAKVLGIPLVHDVCAESHTAKCASFWTEKDDALSIDWHHASTLLATTIAATTAWWMNPPYSNPDPWLLKAKNAASLGLIIAGLLPDDRSTDWYQQHIEDVAPFVFVPDKRINFLLNGEPQQGNPKGSVFPVWMPCKIGHTQYIRFTL